MQLATPLSDVGRVIQLSLAPVFLITGIGSLLAVLSGRLGRTIDRSRVLHTMTPSKEIDAELTLLSTRAKLIYRAMTLLATSALLVSCVIVALFLSAFETFPIGPIIAVLFAAAVIALIGALLMFVREVFLATQNLRIHPR